MFGGGGGGRRFPPPPRGARNPYAGIAREGRTLLKLDDHVAPKKWQDLWGDGDTISKELKGSAKLQNGIIDTVLNALPAKQPRKHQKVERDGLELPRLGSRGLAREAERRKVSYNKQLRESMAGMSEGRSADKVSWGGRRRLVDPGGVPADVTAPRPTQHFQSGQYKQPKRSESWQQPQKLPDAWAGESYRPGKRPGRQKKRDGDAMPSWWGQGTTEIPRHFQQQQAESKPEAAPDMEAAFREAYARASETAERAKREHDASKAEAARRAKQAEKRQRAAAGGPGKKRKKARTAHDEDAGGMSDDSMSEAPMPDPQAEQRAAAAQAAALAERRAKEAALADANHRRQESFRQKPPEKINSSNMPWPTFTIWNTLPLPTEAQGDPEAQRKHLTRLQLFWHPDKVEQRYGHKMLPEERESILEKVKDVAQKINLLKDQAAAAASAPAPAGEAGA